MSTQDKKSVTSGGDDLARRNVRLALVLASVALAFFVTFFVVLSK